MGLFGFRRPPAPLPARRPFARFGPDDTGTGVIPQEALLTPGQVFTPTQPKPGSRQLTGRQAELARILQAVGEDRAHVVLYSERGRGKTSLSNMVIESLRKTGLIVGRHTCDAGSDFDSIMRGLLRDLPASLLASPAEGGHGEGCEPALPGRTLRPGDMLAVPSRLACRGLVCLVDEFDRVTHAETRTQLADTIKQLSDRDAPLLFMVVGVSQNLDEILGQHPSIQRSVLGVHLPLFTDRDVAQLITKGGRETGFTFGAPAVARIVVLSRGMPYMAQLLGLRLTQAANARGSTQVNEDDLDAAVTRMVGDANPSVLAQYAELTERGRNAEMVHTLRRVATAPQDQWGRLEVVPLPDGRVSLGGRAVAAEAWQRLVSGGLLTPVGKARDLYVFAERALMQHVLLLAAREIAGPDLSVADAAPTEPAGAAGRGPVLLRPVASNA